MTSTQEPLVDPGTLAAYDAGAATYAARGMPPAAERAAALVAARVGAAPVLDLGCGTGFDLGALGEPVVGLDPSAGMLAEARRAHPGVPLVRATAGALPFRPQALGGAWASKSLQHVAAVHLPLALADLHRALAVGAPLAVRAFGGEGVRTSDGRDDLPGRRLTFWSPDDLAALVESAAFADVAVTSREASAPGGWPYLDVVATRARSLPATVGPGMDLLLCGLNPSLHAADAGYGYAGPSNRLWPALAEAGLLPEGAEHDPWQLLARGRIGMTSLVKRATPRASDLTAEEYRAGVARLERLCTLLAPAAVVIVGLVGWRAGADRRAVAGWQERRLGPTPVYVMPSTSGLNAATSRAELAAHLRAAASGPAGPRATMAR